MLQHCRGPITSLKNNHALVEQSFHSTILGDEDDSLHTYINLVEGDQQIRTILFSLKFQIVIVLTKKDQGQVAYRDAGGLENRIGEEGLSLPGDRNKGYLLLNTIQRLKLYVYLSYLVFCYNLLKGKAPCSPF